MFLHCDPPAFQRIREVCLLAELEDTDQTYAALKCLDIEPPPIGTEIEVIVDIPADRVFPMGRATLNDNRDEAYPVSPMTGPVPIWAWKEGE